MSWEGPDTWRDEDYWPRADEDFQVGRGCAPAADESRESGCIRIGCRGGDHGERALLSPCAPTELRGDASNPGTRQVLAPPAKSGRDPAHGQRGRGGTGTPAGVGVVGARCPNIFPLLVWTLIFAALATGWHV